jgi:hypothetical protein
MERTEPINPERRASLLVKILLYPQVSAFKIMKAIPSISDYQKNYHSRSFGFVWLIFTETFLFDYFYGSGNLMYFKRFLLAVSVFHGSLEFIFNKTINEMAFDYYAYYNKTLLYFYLVFMAVGLVGFCIWMNNSIGHV